MEDVEHPLDLQVNVIIYHVPIFRIYTNYDRMVKYGGADKIAELLSVIVRRVINHVLINHRNLIARLLVNKTELITDITTVREHVKKRLDIYCTISDVDDHTREIHLREHEFNRIRDLLISGVAKAEVNINLEIMN